MKSFISTLVIIIMCVFLSACGSNFEDDDDDDRTSKSSDDDTLQSVENPLEVLIENFLSDSENDTSYNNEEALLSNTSNNDSSSSIENPFSNLMENLLSDSNVPPKKQIISDLPNDFTSCSIENPFTNVMELQEFEVTNLEIDRSQTTDTDYTAYCIVDMENDYYKYTKYLVCDYKKYDGNIWFLESCREYQDFDYCVLANPFSESDVPEDFINNTYYNNIKSEISLSDNTIVSTCIYDKYHPYKISTYTLCKDYSFNGSCWENIYFDSSVSNTWNIIGSWMLCDEGNYEIFELVINSFDSKTLTATGYCLYQSFNPYSNSKYYKYNLNEAIITENSEGDLIIDFDETLNVSGSYSSYDHYIQIGNDNSCALGKDIERFHINHNLYSSIDYSSVESLQSNDVTIPLFCGSGLTVNGNILCWKGAHWIDRELWGSYSVISFLEFVYSDDKLQYASWYHIFGSEDQAKYTILKLLETNGECMGYNLDEITISYNGNIIKITQKPEAMEQCYQNIFDNIKSYEDLGSDIFYY